MKVLFLTRRFWPQIGGVERHVFEVTKELLKRGHDVTVVSEAPDEAYSPNWQSDAESATFTGRFKIYRMPPLHQNGSKKLEIWKWLWENRNLIENSEIIHAHDIYFWYMPFRLLNQAKRSYITFHGHETTFPPRHNAVLIRRLSNKFATSSIQVGDYITKWYKTKSKIITYGGVKVPKKISSVHLNKKTPINLLFLGRVEKDNGVEVYEKLLGLLKKEKIDFRFTVVGDGSLRGNLEKFGKIIGFVRNPEDYVEKADVVLTSSYLSMLESMVRGRVVIAAYADPLKKDYIEMSPFKELILSGSDIPRLLLALSQLQGDPRALESHIDKARRWAFLYTWEKVADSYERLWRV